MRAAMEFIANFVDDDVMRPFFGRLLQPGPEEDWVEYAQSTYDCYHHGVGTCIERRDFKGAKGTVPYHSPALAQTLNQVVDASGPHVQYH